MAFVFFKIKTETKIGRYSWIFHPNIKKLNFRPKNLDFKPKLNLQNIGKKSILTNFLPKIQICFDFWAFLIQNNLSNWVSKMKFKTFQI